MSKKISEYTKQDTLLNTDVYALEDTIYDVTKKVSYSALKTDISNYVTYDTIYTEPINMHFRCTDFATAAPYSDNIPRFSTIEIEEGNFIYYEGYKGTGVNNIFFKCYVRTWVAGIYSVTFNFTASATSVQYGVISTYISPIPYSNRDSLTTSSLFSTYTETVKAYKTAELNDYASVNYTGWFPAGSIIMPHTEIVDMGDGCSFEVKYLGQG